MALRNAQYNTILREYDRRRFENKHILDQRTEEVYTAIPEYRQLDQDIVTASVSYARELLRQTDRPDSPLEDLEQHNRFLSEHKRKLLIGHGYPSDYLDPVYTCPDCQDTGYIDGRKCHCFKQAIVDLVYSQSNLKHVLCRENFRTFSFDYYSKDYIEETTHLTPYDNMQKVHRICRHFTDTFDASYENLFLYGNTGVGKTFLLNCIAKELLDSAHTVLYFSAPAFFEVFEKNKFGRNDNTASIAEEQFQYIFDCDLLIIDDLGTELNNSFISSQLYQCINERHLQQKSTVISTNIPWNDMGRHYSERVFSRITSDYTLLKIVGDDIRLKKVFGGC